MSLAESVTGIAGKVLDKFVQDKDLKAKLDQELNMAFHNANLAQIELNKEEAKNTSLFVSGWRPSVGWICSFALGYHFILEPLISYILAIVGYDINPPSFDFSQLSTILMGMLGLGGLRSYEKFKGVDRK